MHNYEFEIRLNSIAKKLDIVWEKIIESDRKEIMQLPKEEQKPYWQKLNYLESVLDEAETLILMQYNELLKRGDVEDVQTYKNLYNNAKKYIKTLGGNTSLLPYIQPNDLT